MTGHLIFVKTYLERAEKRAAAITETNLKDTGHWPMEGRPEETIGALTKSLWPDRHVDGHGGDEDGKVQPDTESGGVVMRQLRQHQPILGHAAWTRAQIASQITALP